MFTALVAIALVAPHDGNAWHAMALETIELDESTRGEAVLDDHAHKRIGKYPTPQEAFAAAQSFADAWVKGHESTRAEECDCDEIGGSRG